MTRIERIEFRISKELKEKIKRVADAKEVSVSELITDYIKTLPDPKETQSLGFG